MSRDALERARDLISTAERVVAFSGAGLSAESGIPTFRDASDDALWSRFDPMELASPEGFARRPEIVLAWYADRRRAAARAVPNAAHRALASCGGIVQVTQNVDDLLERAGATDPIHLHGTLTRDRCHGGCGFEEPIDLTDPPGPRPCPRCGQPLRPAVVWFGEMLPSTAWRAAEDACRACDALIVVGTSATVYPAAGLIDLASASGARIVVVNTARSAASTTADIEIIGPAAAQLPRILGHAP